VIEQAGGGGGGEILQHDADPLYGDRAAISSLAKQRDVMGKQMTRPRVGRSEKNSSLNSEVLPAPERPGEETGTNGRGSGNEVAQNLRGQARKQYNISTPHQAQLRSMWARPDT